MSSCHPPSPSFYQMAEGAPPRLAIAGNPNTGKTTLFNQLTGLNAQVGNYPGVTVDRRTGLLRAGDILLEVMDVPGCYSLGARSHEEELAISSLLGLAGTPTPDLVVVVVDATQLERNLYLVLQLLELGRPLVVALNMMDEIRHRGITLDIPGLEHTLGVPVVPMAAGRGEGIDTLRNLLGDIFGGKRSLPRGPQSWVWEVPPPVARALDEIEPLLGELPLLPGEANTRRAFALWALMSVDRGDELTTLSPAVKLKILEIFERISGEGHDLDALVIQGRYGWIDGITPGLLSRPAPTPTWTDRLDHVFTHPVFGFGIFLGLMFLVFWSLFAWSEPAINLVESLFGAAGEWVAATVGPGLVSEFLVEGVIGGVGSVLVFLPQILLLFLFIAILEGSGYMARAAFLMDRIMNAIGLHGRAFVPLISGYACAIPAVMATRTMESQRDRLLTMMVVPLMSCSARLPVYSLLIAALFPPDIKVGPFAVSAFLMVAMYLFSTVMALIAAAVIGRTVLKGKRIPLLLEMPPYRLPDIRSVLRMMAERARVFVTEAGTVIMACTLVLWGLLSFPREHVVLFEEAAPAPTLSQAADAELESQAQLTQSWGGRLGQWIEPAIEPLGFDWKIGIGIIGAFAAREVFVSTLGVVYGVADADEESEGLRQKLRDAKGVDGKPRYTPLVGLSLMVFFALACQCMSTLAVIRRETRSWRWPIFVFSYMSILAYVCSLVIYQGGRLLGFS